MSDQELKEFVEALERIQQQHSAVPETGRKFLVDAGILTEEGDLAAPYRSICPGA